MLMNTTYLQDTAWQGLYAFPMQSARTQSRAIVAANVRALMERRGWTQEQVAAKAGISQTHVGNVLRQDTDCRTAILEALGKAFGVPAWLLLVPGLKPEVLDSPEIPLLLERYAAFVPPRPR